MLCLSTFFFEQYSRKGYHEVSGKYNSNLYRFMILYIVHLKVLDVGEKCIRVYDSLGKFRHDVANKLRQECLDMNVYMFSLLY